MLRLPRLLRLPSKLRRRARRSRMALLLTLATLACFLVTPFYVIYKPPVALIRFFEWKWPDVLFRVAISEKVVALTIDDAPSEYSLDIHAALDANDAKATFFVIGKQIHGREEILKTLVRNGHELGNHAMRDEASRDLKDVTLKEQIQNVHKSITSIYKTTRKEDEPPRYFRPGSGFFSDHMRKMLASIDFRLVLGNIYPHDPQISSPAVNGRHILSMLRPGGIIICHDRRSWTSPMLSTVLPEIKRRGYRVVTISELLRLGKTI